MSHFCLVPKLAFWAKLSPPDAAVPLSWSCRQELNMGSGSPASPASPCRPATHSPKTKKLNVPLGFPVKPPQKMVSPESNPKKWFPRRTTKKHVKRVLKRQHNTCVRKVESSDCHKNAILKAPSAIQKQSPAPLQKKMLGPGVYMTSHVQ